MSELIPQGYFSYAYSTGPNASPGAPLQLDIQAFPLARHLGVYARKTPGGGMHPALLFAPHGLNNPSRYTDPTGHKPCDGDYDEKGHCDDSNYKLLDLLDYVEGEIVNENGKIRNKYTSLEAMLLVVKKAASIYGRDWNGFLDATTYVFTGYYGHGHEAMASAGYENDFDGYFEGASGFHPDFIDTSNQVRHFWAAFATAADPYGDNPVGEASASFGNWWHDIATDGFGNDGATVMDYELSITGIDIAAQVGNEIKTPSSLMEILLYRLGVGGPGYTGPEVNPARWITPWD